MAEVMYAQEHSVTTVYSSAAAASKYTRATDLRELEIPYFNEQPQMHLHFTDRFLKVSTAAD